MASLLGDHWGSGYSLCATLGEDCFFDSRRDGDESLAAHLVHVRLSSSHIEVSAHALVFKAPAVCDLDGRASFGRLTRGWDPAAAQAPSVDPVKDLPSRWVAATNLPVFGLYTGKESLRSRKLFAWPGVIR